MSSSLPDPDARPDESAEAGSPEVEPAPPAGPDAVEASDADADGPTGPASTPLGLAAERYRLPLGLIVGLAFLAFTAWLLFGLRVSSELPGFYGLVQAYAFPLMTTLIGAVALTWAFRLDRRVTNALAYLAIGTYLFYLATGWIYDSFVR